jgi:subtilisin family serine protease
MIRTLLLAVLLACSAAAHPAAAEPDAAVPRQVLVLVPMPPPHFRPDGHYGGGYADPASRAAGRRTAAALARAYGLHMATDWPMPAIGMDCYVMDVPASMRPTELAERLGREPGVAWAQAMNVFHTLGHDDPLFAQQPAAVAWHLAELHRSVTGRDVRVAVIDSGVQADHPDLAGALARHSNFVPGRPDVAELHGTAVAGIIAARADNHVGIVGIAPQARLLALRACWQDEAAHTWCSSLSLALALSAALEDGAQVVNLSLGGPADPLVQRLIEAAQSHGAVVVAARDDRVPGGGFPASLRGVIAVGSAPAAGRAPGPTAPGTDVLSTLPGSRWGIVSGNSYAAAHVSGLLALVIEARSRTGPLHVRAPAAPDLVTGPDAAIDACATLDRAGVACACDCGAAALATSATQP